MPEFTIEIGRDARVYHKRTVVADSLEEAQEKLTRHGFDDSDQPVGAWEAWKQTELSVFDEVEAASLAVSDASGEHLVSTWENGEGWTDVDPAARQLKAS